MSVKIFLGSMDISTTLMLCLLLIIFHSFQYTSLSLTWFTLFPGVLLVLTLLYMRFSTVHFPVDSSLLVYRSATHFILFLNKNLNI